MKNILAIEGKIVNFDGLFLGRVEINTKTGLIEKVGKAIGQSDLDCKDCLIFPGFGDLHVHAREDETGKQTYKEDYKTAADGALNGGVAYISAMPNTPSPVVGKEQWQWHRAVLKKLIIRSRF